MSTIAATLESIAGAFRRRTVDQVKNLRELTVQIADGKKVDPARVAELLAEAGKEPQDLAGAVSLLQHRRQLKARVAATAAAGIVAERQRIDRAAIAANAALEAAEQRHAELIAGLQFRLRELAAIERDGADADNDLRRTCGDEDVLREAAEVGGQLKDLGGRELQQQAAARQAGRAAEGWRSTERTARKSEYADSDLRAKQAAEEAQIAEDNLKRLQALGEQLASERRELEERKAAVELRKLCVD